MSHDIEGYISIRATNNRGFDLASPTSLFLEAGNRANDTVTLSAPLNTPSGTDVTLTIEAEAAGGQDTNYVVMRFSVFNTVKLPLKSHFYSYKYLWSVIIGREPPYVLLITGKT